MHRDNCDAIPSPWAMTHLLQFTSQSSYPPKGNVSVGLNLGLFYGYSI